MYDVLVRARFRLLRRCRYTPRQGAGVAKPRAKRKSKATDGGDYDAAVMFAKLVHGGVYCFAFLKKLSRNAREFLNRTSYIVLRTWPGPPN